MQYFTFKTILACQHQLESSLAEIENFCVFLIYYKFQALQYLMSSTRYLDSCMTAQIKVKLTGMADLRIDHSTYNRNFMLVTTVLPFQSGDCLINGSSSTIKTYNLNKIIRKYYQVRCSHSYQCCFCHCGCLQRVQCGAVFGRQQMSLEVGNQVPMMRRPRHRHYIRT